MWEFIPCGICHPQATHLVKTGCSHLSLSHLLLGGRGMRWNFCQHSTGTAPRQHVPAFQGRSQVPSPEQRHPASRDGLAGEHRQEGTGSSTGSGTGSSSTGCSPLLPRLQGSCKAGIGASCRHGSDGGSCWAHSAAAALLAAGWMVGSLSCLGNYRARTWQSRQHETKLVHKFTGQGLMNSWSPQRVPVP